MVKKIFLLVLLFALKAFPLPLSYNERQELIKEIGEKKLSALEWIMGYYTAPNADEVPAQIIKLSKAGLLKTNEYFTYLVFGFITGLFRQHDTLVGQWTKYFRWLPRDSKDFLTVCLNMSGTHDITIDGKSLEQPMKKKVLLNKLYFDTYFGSGGIDYIYNLRDNKIISGIIDYKCGEFYATGSSDCIDVIASYLKYKSIYEKVRNRKLDWTDPVNIVGSQLYEKAHQTISFICTEKLGRQNCEKILKNSKTDVKVKVELIKLLKQEKGS